MYHTKRHVVADTNRNENDLSVWLRCRVPIRWVVTSAVCPMGRPPNPKDLSPCQPAPLGSSRATAFGRRDQPERILRMPAPRCRRFRFAE